MSTAPGDERPGLFPGSPRGRAEELVVAKIFAKLDQLGITGNFGGRVPAVERLEDVDDRLVASPAHLVRHTDPIERRWTAGEPRGDGGRRLEGRVAVTAFAQ